MPRAVQPRRFRRRLPRFSHIVATAFAIVAGLVTLSGREPRQSADQASAAGVLSPEAALRTFTLPAGYHLELVASEPLIQEPVAIDWDSDGRLWLVEMPGYMRDIAATSEHDPLGRVVVLEDTNHDGTLDKRTVFADGLVSPRALKVLDAGVLVGEPPDLWLMRDTNHDLKADTKELVTDKFGRRDANVEHNANTLLWAMDNTIYTSEVDLMLRLRHGRFDVLTTLPRGQWGASQDDAGRVFRNDNTSALNVDLVPTHYFIRNPALTRTRGSYEFLGGTSNDLNVTWPDRPTPGVNRGYQTGVLRADGRLASFTAAAAPTVYRGDRLPSELYGSVFVVEPAGNLVSRIVVSDDGKTLRGRKAYERTEFITSTDERFRPVYLSSAPDGTLYVVDMHHGIIQHKGFITEYLRDQILSRRLDQPIGHGRIYRVVHETTTRGSVPSIGNMSADELVGLLSHPNGWWRDTAQRLLVERNDASAVAPLMKAAASAREPRTRLHALWALDGMQRLDVSTVSGALRDSSRDVRASAVRLSERWLREANPPLVDAVLKLTADDDWAVREQLAASLGELPRPLRISTLASFLDSHGTDPIVVDAGISGLAGSEAAVLDRLLEAAADTPARAATITMLAATIIATSQDVPVQALFEKMSDTARPAWQRSALLRGAEVSLLGAVAPGNPDGRGRAPGVALSATSTAAGARGGPGGAPAFPQAAPARATLLGGRGGRPSLKVTREPALTALAQSDAGDLASRAAAVLARVEWPGKPGVAAGPTPLTASEQARYQAGQAVYQDLCVACHQANGQGLEKVAPPLVGSELALASPPVPVRILLNGKEGSIGLMPPLGSVLNDDQIASVLTYVRRAWSNGGTPIDPQDVARIRPTTTGRTRPWTNAELMALGGVR